MANNERDKIAFTQEELDSIRQVEIRRHELDSIKEANASYWSISTSTDELTGKAAHFAQLKSTNTVNFSAPYDGGSYLTLTLRDHPQYKKDAYIKISKGQFMHSSVYGTKIKIRFDDGEVETYECGIPSDHSFDLLFIRNYSKLVKKLKASKECIIQCEFYNQGNWTFKFKTQNLKWDY